MHSVHQQVERYLSTGNGLVRVVNVLRPQLTSDRYRDSDGWLGEPDPDQRTHVLRLSLVGEELGGESSIRSVLDPAHVLLVDQRIALAVQVHHVVDGRPVGDLDVVLELPGRVRLRYPVGDVVELEEDARFPLVVSVVHRLAALQHKGSDVKLADAAVVLLRGVAEAFDDFRAAVSRRGVADQQLVQLLGEVRPHAALHGK